MNKNDQQKLNRQILTCEHGMDGYCWWCTSLKNKPLENQIRILDDRFEALLLVVKMLIKNMIQQKPGGFHSTGIVSQIVGSSLISSGSDASKPSDGGNLAFYFATDTDVIYQRRAGSWIDISFSKPADGDARITNIETDASTGTLEVTDTN